MAHDAKHLDLSRQLPPELWPKVFRGMIFHDLVNLTVVCATFRDIAQPLLFTLVVFTDSIFQGDKWMSKLQFLKLPRIAPSVKRLVLRPTTFDGVDRARLPQVLQPIFDALASSLETFVNLKFLDFFQIPVSPSVLTKAVAVQSRPLRCLSMHNVDLQSLESSAIPTVPVEELRMSYNSSGMRDMIPITLVLEKLVHPDVLASLTILVHAGLFDAIPDGFECRLRESLLFPQLRRLSFQHDGLTYAPWVPLLLSRAPNLALLDWIDATENYGQPIDPSFLARPELCPALRGFCGSIDALPALLPGRAVRHLNIGRTPFIPGPPDSVMSALEHIGKESLGNIETLHIAATDVTQAMLKRLWGSLPRLKAVAIRRAALAQDSGTNIAALITMLMNVPPPDGIEYVSIDGSPTKNTAPGVTVDLHHVSHMLTRGSSTLQHVEISLPQFDVLCLNPQRPLIKEESLSLDDWIYYAGGLDMDFPHGPGDMRSRDDPITLLGRDMEFSRELWQRDVGADKTVENMKAFMASVSNGTTAP